MVVFVISFLSLFFPTGHSQNLPFPLLYSPLSILPLSSTPLMLCAIVFVNSWDIFNLKVLGFNHGQEEPGIWYLILFL